MKKKELRALIAQLEGKIEALECRLVLVECQQITSKFPSQPAHPMSPPQWTGPWYNNENNYVLLCTDADGNALEVI